MMASREKAVDKAQQANTSHASSSAIPAEEVATSAAMPAGPTARGRLQPRSPTPRSMFQLQRMIGNRAVARLVAADKQSSTNPEIPVGTTDETGAEAAGRQSAPDGATRAEEAVVQRAYELCKPGDVTHDEDHRAKKVVVRNIAGTPLGAAANSPVSAGNPFGWPELTAAGHTLSNPLGHSTHYNAVRMHLWNGRLGGPGDKFWNLAPGPAKVNSMMSAGPETAAKMLVEAGYTIWLSTEVKYMNNSANATDFTSVVPNQIDMKWGVMGDPSTDDSWSSPIQLPVAPLQGAAAQEYVDWPKDQPDALVAKLQSETDQVRAQAFDLVQHTELKWAIINAFPKTFLSMEKHTKGRILTGMPDDILAKFLPALGVSSPDVLVDEVLLPLAAVGGTARLQHLFSTLLDAGAQRKMLIAYKGDLLQHLGALAEDFSKRDWTIFKYNSEAGQVNLLASMSAAEINGFLAARTSTDRTNLLSMWAGRSGAGDAAAKASFVDGIATVADQYKVEFRKAMAVVAQAEEYLRKRPPMRGVRKAPATKGIVKPTKRSKKRR